MKNYLIFFLVFQISQVSFAFSNEVVLLTKVRTGNRLNPSLDSSPAYVSNIAALKAFPTTSIQESQLIFTLGYYVPGDGGGAMYRYSSQSSTSSDGGTVHTPNSGSGRWLLISPEINLKQFGAFGNGINDDTEPIRAAIRYASGFTGAIGNNRKTVIVPSGDYIVGSQIIIPHEIMLVGSNRASCRFWAKTGFPGNTSVFKIGNSASNYEHANGLKSVSVNCDAKADIGVEIFNCNENGGLYDFEVKGWRKTGVVINGNKAINFGIRDGHVVSRVVSISDPIAIDIQTSHHPLAVQRVTCIPMNSSGPTANGIGIRCRAGGYSIVSIVDCHFEGVLYGVSAESGRVSVANCDGTSNVKFLVNFSNQVEGLAERLMINSDNGSKSIRDASLGFAANPISFGTYSFFKRYASGRKKGLGAVWTSQFIITTNQNGTFTILHGMPAAPTVANLTIVSLNTSEHLQLKVTSITDTQITGQLFDLRTFANIPNRTNIKVSAIMEL